MPNHILFYLSLRHPETLQPQKHQEKKEVDENGAATAIQAAMRGFSTRKQLEKEKRAATKVQALFRGHKVRAERTASTEKLVAAPAASASAPPHRIGLPNHLLYYLSLRHPETLQDKRRDESTKATEEEAATAIQAVMRGHNARKQLEKEKHAATKLQAVVRGHQTRAALAAASEDPAKRYTF